MTELRQIISTDFAKALTKKLGYEFKPDRLERIAVEARYAMTQGLPAPHAFSHALSLELDMYGDPNSQCMPVGLLGLT